MVIYILNCLALLFCVMASSRDTGLDQLLRFCFMLLAIYNGFEAYRFYIMGA